MTTRVTKQSVSVVMGPPDPLARVTKQSVSVILGPAPNAPTRVTKQSVSAVLGPEANLRSIRLAETNLESA